MLKRKLIIPLSIVLSIYLSSCGTGTDVQREQFSSGVRGESSSNEKTVQNPDLKMQEKASKNEPVIYNIVGQSNKLSKTEQESMERWRKNIVTTAENNTGKIFINGQSDEKTVCLTFDDGPDSSVTPKILDILKKYNVKASFFFIGNRLKSYSNIVKRVDQEGHLVLNHSWSHADLKNKSISAVKKEIQSTQDGIFSIIGKRPALMRPPYGDIDQTGIDEINREGLKAIIWSIDTLDWSQRDKSNIVKNVTDNIRPGDVILMHSNEDKTATVQALPGIIEKLREKGYKFLNLSEMLGVEAYQ